MPLNAVTVSPDGSLLAYIYSRDDSDMREEPELCVYDLRPMVRELLWQARKSFLMIVFGHSFLPMQDPIRKCKDEQAFLGGIVAALSETHVAPATTTVFRGPPAQSENEADLLDGVGNIAPSHVCRVFCNLALVKCIVQYIV